MPTKTIIDSKSTRKNNMLGYNTLSAKRLSVEDKAKLSQLETQNTSSAVFFIYNFQLREFRFVLYR